MNYAREWDVIDPQADSKRVCVRAMGRGGGGLGGWDWRDPRPRPIDGGPHPVLELPNQPNDFTDKAFLINCSVGGWGLGPIAAGRTKKAV